TRLLNPYPAASLEQHARRNLQCLLRSADNHDLLYIAIYCSNRSKISRNRRAKFFGSHRIAEMKRPRVYPLTMLRQQSRPQRKRKMVQAHLAHPECSPPVNPGAGMESRNNIGVGRYRPWTGIAA